MNTDRTVSWMGVAACVFGAVTVMSGGQALFGSVETRAALGNIVPFVLWFNFLAGFLYISAGAGLLLRKRWAVHLAQFLAIATSLVFVAFGTYVLGGGAFEPRTVGAMTVRSLFWIAVAMVAARALHKSRNYYRSLRSNRFV